MSDVMDALESASPALPEEPCLHVRIAEQGKLYALEHRHELALAYYRQAIRMCVQAGDPEIFFRHYLECVLESLERMAGYTEVLNYCDKAIELLSASTSELAPAELAHVYQRQGVVRLKAGDRDAALDALRNAVGFAGNQTSTVPLSRTLIGWLERGFQVDVRRIEAEQERTHYFSVRQDTVDRSRAVKLPNEQLVLGIGARS